MVATIDVAQDVRLALPRLKTAGILNIIRYDCRPVRGRWKEASAAEFQAILAAGMHYGVVNEGIGNVAGAFTDSTGYLDAKYSRGRAPGRSQPPGTAIYFAVDFDPTSANVRNNILPYFRGVRRAMLEDSTPALPRLKVGVYGSGMAAQALRDAGLVDYVWITCSGGFAGSRAYVAAGREDLWQYACEKNLAGLDVDYNLSPTGLWGQVPLVAPEPAPPGPSPSPPAPPVPPSPEPPPGPSLWPAAWGPQVGKATWYDDSTNADMEPVHNATDMTAASVHIPFHTRVKVTRLPDGESCVVTVTDRGPYVAGRILDLRPAAAKALGFGASYGNEDPGVIAVKMERA